MHCFFHREIFVVFHPHLKNRYNQGLKLFTIVCLAENREHFINDLGYLLFQLLYLLLQLPIIAIITSELQL